MTFGELLARFAEFWYEFWPLRIVNDWEQGIRLYKGRTTRLLRPGLHWFIPLLGEIVIRDTTTEVLETDLQTVTTNDGIEATFSLAVKLRITNLRLNYTKIHSTIGTVHNEVEGRAAWACGVLDYSDLQHCLGSDTHILAREQLRKWGIDLIEVSTTTLTRATGLRILQE